MEKAMKKVWFVMILLFVMMMAIIGIVLFLASPKQLPVAVVKLAPDNPVALRPGEQVPLMRFQVTASSTDAFLPDEIYFSLFYEAGEVESIGNFTLWNDDVLLSRNVYLNQTVKFSPSVVIPALIPAHSSVIFTIRSDIFASDGATMKMSLFEYGRTLKGLPLTQSLQILRP